MTNHNNTSLIHWYASSSAHTSKLATFQTRKLSMLAQRPAIASGGVLVVAIIFMNPGSDPCWLSHTFLSLGKWHLHTWLNVAVELKYFHLRPSLVENTTSQSFKCVWDMRWYWCFWHWSPKNTMNSYRCSVAKRDFKWFLTETWSGPESPVLRNRWI